VPSGENGPPYLGQDLTDNTNVVSEERSDAFFVSAAEHPVVVVVEEEAAESAARCTNTQHAMIAWSGAMRIQWEGPFAKTERAKMRIEPSLGRTLAEVVSVVVERGHEQRRESIAVLHLGGHRAIQRTQSLVVIGTKSIIRSLSRKGMLTVVNDQAMMTGPGLETGKCLPLHDGDWVEVGPVSLYILNTSTHKGAYACPPPITTIRRVTSSSH
jgi:hypothetical protein